MRRKQAAGLFQSLCHEQWGVCWRKVALCLALGLITTLQIVAGSKIASDSFIIQWAQRWLPEDNKYRSLDTTAIPSDQSKVDNLLMQFMAGGDIRTKSVSFSLCPSAFVCLLCVICLSVHLSCCGYSILSCTGASLFALIDEDTLLCENVGVLFLSLMKMKNSKIVYTCIYVGLTWPLPDLCSLCCHGLS